jgi:hypothetical protein
MKQIAVKVYRDGNQWCALMGEDLQQGIAGFGDTIPEALDNLQRAVRAYNPPDDDVLVEEFGEEASL